MDRSFLSDKDVIDASREFVCIRLATYESKEEAAVLKSIFIGRSGDLENTTFALLTPEGKRIGRAGRSPRFMFDDAAALADEMDAVAARYPHGSRERRELPVMKNVRLALDVASCDNSLLVVGIGRDKRETAKLESKLAEVAWVSSLSGQFVYAMSSDARELAPISGVERASGIIVVEPDTYGQKGAVTVALPADASKEAIAAALGKARAAYKPEPKDHESHVREGHRKGVHWDTEIPDTDPGPPGGRPPRGR